MLRKITSLIFLLLVVSGCSKGKAEDPGLNIVTSFYPVYAITDFVSGDLNNVSMIESNAGIHHFEPSANDIAAIEDSDVFIFHSTTLESWVKNMENLDDTEVIEATESMDLLFVPGLEDFEVPKGMSEKSLYDPHSWNDPIYAAKEAQIIADRLSKIDPDNKDHYQANAKTFEKQANDLVAKYEKELTSKKNNKFVTQHTAFQYISERFNLEEVGIGGVSDDIELSPKRMIEITEYIKDNDIQVIFKENRSSGNFAETIAQELGIKVAVLDSLEADPQNGKNYLENMEINLQTLDENLE